MVNSLSLLFFFSLVFPPFFLFSIPFFLSLYLYLSLSLSPSRFLLHLIFPLSLLSPSSEVRNVSATKMANLHPIERGFGALSRSFNAIRKVFSVLFTRIDNTLICHGVFLAPISRSETAGLCCLGVRAKE